MTAENRHYRRQRGRVRGSSGRYNLRIQPQSLFGQGWSPDSPGHCRPHGLVSTQIPKQPCVRLEFESREIVVLEFRSNGQTQSTVNQTDLVLQKRAELIQAKLIRLQRDCEAGIVPVENRSVTKSPLELL